MEHDLDFLDETRDAQERAFTQHDTLTFLGYKLRPMSVGTQSLLERTNNRLLYGTDAPFFDAAAFALLHIADEDKSREVRAAAWSGHVAWNEYVFRFLDETPGIDAELAKCADMFGQMIRDYAAVLTKSINAPAGKKKPGNPAGSHGSSPRSPKRPAGATKR